MIESARKILNKTFGYKNFRPLQEEAINSILHHNDTLIIMPTGGGKSLCYQIPAMLFEGITVVVSPLISLMKDQVQQIREFGINAVYLNSSLSREEYRENISLLQNGAVKLLYVAPETLFQERTINLLLSLNVDFITVDEAHCISEWGHDFRPEYRQIVQVRKYFPGAVFAAVTATATPRVQKDIKDTLKLNGNNIFIASFNRENLYLEITPKTNGILQVKRFLQRYPNQSGIIYCFSRKQVDSIYTELSESGYSVRPYHAGLSDEERHTNQELFIKDDVQIIVATIAFGMGINKSNVRFVVHFDLPKNIESYYQEIGRAGRDGLRSHCLMLFSYSDIQKIRYFIDQKEDKERRVAELHLNSLIHFAESYMCRRIPLLSYFGEQHEQQKCGMCDNCNVTDKDLVDVTIPAQKFLSCVKRTNELFGAVYITDVLKGSKNAKIFANGHENLSTYNIGNEYTKKQWLYLSHQFIHQQLLVQDSEYGSLKLTAKAYEVLRGDLSITGKIKDDIDVQEEKTVSENYDHNLFDKLRKRRKEIADKSKLPPYVIFSDKTLTEMASYFPVDKKEMLRIHGLGEIKFQRYGNIFINEIIDYCEQNNIKPNGKNALPAKTKTGKSKTSAVVSYGKRFNEGMSISDIIKETRYKRSVVLKHLLDFVEEDEITSPERLLEDSSLSEEKQYNVLKTFDEHGSDNLDNIYEVLDKKINKIELQLMKIYYLAINRKEAY